MLGTWVTYLNTYYYEPQICVVLQESLLTSFSSFCACFSLFQDGWNSRIEHDTYVYLALLALTFFGISRHFNSNSEIRGILASKRYHHWFSLFTMPNVSYVFSHCKPSYVKYPTHYALKLTVTFLDLTPKYFKKRQHPLLFVFSSMFGSGC